MAILIKEITDRWDNPLTRPLLKGRLINKENCMCAQGDILHTFCGWSFERLRSVNQLEADQAVAAKLGISVAHSVLLRTINDSQNGAPSIVLTEPEKVLGSEAIRILKFWKYLDFMRADDWNTLNAMRDATRDTSWWKVREAALDASWDAAGDASWDAAVRVAQDAVRDALRISAGNAKWIACWATNEIQGQSRLNTFYFLPLFGFNSMADIDALKL